MDVIMGFLPILFPALIFIVISMAVTFRQVLKPQKFRFWKKPAWIVVSLIPLIGVVLYFRHGREREDERAKYDKY